MSKIQDTDRIIDDLATEAGGYFSFPSADEKEYTNLFFTICRKYGIRYAHATPKEKFFIDEVTRVTWEHLQQKKTGEPVEVRPAFSR